MEVASTINRRSFAHSRGGIFGAWKPLEHTWSFLRKKKKRPVLQFGPELFCNCAAFAD